MNYVDLYGDKFMSDFNPQLTHQLAIAIAIAAIASVITLILLYAGIPFFGPVNDLINALSAILIVIFMWQFHVILEEKNAALAVLIQLAALVGGVLISGNSVLVAFGEMEWKTGGMYTAIGYALIGLWLVGMLLVLKDQAFLNSGLVTLGLVAGVCLLFGFLAGPLLAEKLTKVFTPVVWIAYVATGAGWILFPIWCWRLAVNLR
jgi:MFS family permease